MTTNGHLEHLPIEQLHHYHRNPRKGNIPAIADSIRTNGLYKPLIVNTGTQTGREWEVLAGNHTLHALTQLHQEHQDHPDTTPDHTLAPCYIIDVDEEQAARIVLVDNRSSDLGDYNTETLTDLLQDLPDLNGTAYTTQDLTTLLDGLDNTGDDDSPDPYDGVDPYPDNITIRLSLTPNLAQQWLHHANNFDTPEEALEHLLDHGPLN